VSTSTPPAQQDRPRILSELRSIDPCTLYGDRPQVAGASVTVEGLTSVLSCTARVQTPAGAADISLGVNIASPQDAPDRQAGEHRTIDGVEVIVASSQQPPLLGPQDPKSVTASCNITARYPDRAIISAYVSAAPDVDTCSVAEAMIRQAITSYSRRPAPNPNTPGRTVVTGTDPCAPMHNLQGAHQVSVDWDNSTLSSCFFTLDGSTPIVVSFDILDAAIVQYTPAQPDVDGHRILGGDGIVHVVVDDDITVGGRRLVPTVTITDVPPSHARMQTLIQAVTDQY
jgi:hypothetical protein